MPEKSDNNSVETPKKKPYPGFVKGQPGGPGRPKIVDADRDPLADAERTAQEGMGKKYTMADRLKAATVAIKVKSLRQRKEDPVTTPFVLKLASLLTDLAGRCSEGSGKPVDGLSVVDLMVRTCPGCTLICKARDESELLEDSS
jgi:hypothetical protein